jgi:hypothetical protein
MNVRMGDWVFVNVAPFIGSLRRNRESVLCRVLAIDGPQVEVLTQCPCREFALWVASTWIEGKAEEPMGASSETKQAILHRRLRAAQHERDT